MRVKLMFPHPKPSEPWSARASQRELWGEMVAFPFADRDDLVDTAAMGCAYLLDRREPRAR